MGGLTTDPTRSNRVGRPQGDDCARLVNLLLKIVFVVPSRRYLSIPKDGPTLGFKGNGEPARRLLILASVAQENVCQSSTDDWDDVTGPCVGRRSSPVGLVIPEVRGTLVFDSGAGTKKAINIVRPGSAFTGMTGRRSNRSTASVI